jgi:hypothetical protein
MMIRRLLRRLIKWALAEPKGADCPTLEIYADLAVPERLFISGVSTPTGRRVIVDTIRLAKINREL